jgi:hypothetical protein
MLRSRSKVDASGETTGEAPRFADRAQGRPTVTVGVQTSASDPSPISPLGCIDR